MKALKIIGLMALLTGMTAAAQAQESPADEVKVMVESRNFIFVPQTVTPQRGSLRNLNGGFDLVVAPDSIISYLPYFGRAYSAPINPRENAFDFTSVKFDYKSEAGKKGNWEILVQPQDVSQVREMYLTVYDNGRALLRVNSLNRQPISFNGYIAARPAPPLKGF